MPFHFYIFNGWRLLLFATFGVLLGCTGQTNFGGVQITSYGNRSLLIRGEGKSVLLNPYKAVGCAARLKEPKVRADVILASSELADEGAKVAKGIFFAQPGSYRVGQLAIEGFSVPHDRFGGRRYGQGTVWQWDQGGLRFAHLGGVAAPLKREDKILLGRPDVLVIAVGGGSKVYDGVEAAELVKDLNPRRVIPVQYVRGIKPDNCDQSGIQPFLDAVPGVKVKKVGRKYFLPSKLSDQTIINLME